jgi:hypothetical protein
MLQLKALPGSLNQKMGLFMGKSKGRNVHTMKGGWKNKQSLTWESRIGNHFNLENRMGHAMGVLLSTI